NNNLAILASGDPWHYGIGHALTEELTHETHDTGTHYPLTTIPTTSSMALACARMQWPAETVTIITTVGRDTHTLNRHLHPNTRILTLIPRGTTIIDLAKHLTNHGYHNAELTLLSDLGTPKETHTTATATAWTTHHTNLPTLAIAAINTNTPTTNPNPRHPGLVPGLPDETFTTDGQLTKWETRAITLAALAPRPHELLWDIGSGTGTIALEWCLTHPTTHAISIETRPDRTANITTNAHNLGVNTTLQTITGHAPEALHDLPQPDAIFIGGGATTPQLLETCWDALPPGGRIVANAVTIETENRLISAHTTWGGELGHIQISRAQPIGTYTSWTPARPVTQWRARKPHLINEGTTR
ncbi:precorrin-6Y C5,15-methyltransferase (decarboxylating) subunit CbiT, partial [Dermatophilus congolensis]